MRAIRILMTAGTVWLLADLAHAGWHEVTLDDSSFLTSVPLLDCAILALLALAWSRPRWRRFAGGGLAVTAGIWSVARGISGITAGEGLAIHGLLALSGVPLLLVGCAILARGGRFSAPAPSRAS